MLKESEVERPAFAPLAVGMEFCVLVTWPNGVEARINDFGYQEDAQRWIDREAANWLHNRAQRLSRAPSDEGENLVATTELCNQMLWAA
jgi:hypothetical protein